jgi:hypothetical protein
MTNRIDGLYPGNSYILPGTDVGPAAIDGVDEANGIDDDDDVMQRPFGGFVGEPIAMSANWQDLFGINRVLSEPTQIDPPMMPTSFNEAGPLTKETFFRSLGTSSSTFPSGDKSKEKVDRMVRLMNSSIRAAKRMRTRGTERGAERSWINE